MREAVTTTGRTRRPAGFARAVLKRVIALVVLVLAVRWTSLAESVAVYHPSREPFDTPRGYEDVWIDGSGGVRLHGWFLRAAGAAPGERRAAVLHAHGNAGRLPDHEGFSSYLAGAGFHVLMFDYRGYGRSSPARLLTREKLLADTLAAYDALASRDDVDAGRIGVYGVSLGGTFALHAAARRPGARAVACVAAFSSWGGWRGIAGDHLPILGPMLMPTGLDAVDAMPALAGRPLLLIHGDRDSIVPPRHLGVLRDAASSAGVPVAARLITGGDHNAIIADLPEASAAITAFFVGTLGRAGEVGGGGGEGAFDEPR